MTADEIRAISHDNTEFGSENMLQEIAAQLAELNKNISELVWYFTHGPNKFGVDPGDRDMLGGHE